MRHTFRVETLLLFLGFGIATLDHYRDSPDQRLRAKLGLRTTSAVYTSGTLPPVFRGDFPEWTGSMIEAVDNAAAADYLSAYLETPLTADQLRDTQGKRLDRETFNRVEFVTRIDPELAVRLAHRVILKAKAEARDFGHSSTGWDLRRQHYQWRRVETQPAGRFWIFWGWDKYSLEFEIDLDTGLVRHVDDYDD